MKRPPSPPDGERIAVAAESTYPTMGAGGALRAIDAVELMTQLAAARALFGPPPFPERAMNPTLAAYRAKQAAAARPDLLADTFPAQRAWCEETARFATASCGRRSGKSEGVARKLLAAEQAKPRAPVLYFAQTRAEAKRILWQPLLELNRKHDLGLEPRESTLTLRRGGVERLRGTAYGGCASAPSSASYPSPKSPPRWTGSFSAGLPCPAGGGRATEQ
jgi:hypothetical protein